MIYKQQKVLFTVIAIVMGFLLIWVLWGSHSNFTFKTYPTSSQIFLKSTDDHVGFNNSEYQTYPPSTDIQGDYYSCIANECDGNTFDYACLQKCYLKSYRRHMSTPDHADWVCYRHRYDKDKYYQCLANVYADYKFP